MQVSVQEGLGVVHEVQAQLCNLGMKRLITVQLFLNKSLVPRGDDVSPFIIVVRFGQHQVFGNFAEFGVCKELYTAFFLLGVQHQIRRRQQRVNHKNRQIPAEMRINTVRSEFLTQVSEGRNIFHRGGSHDLVIVIEFRHKPGSKFPFQTQSGGFDSAAVLVQQTPRGAQQPVCLFDYDGMSVF